MASTASTSAYREPGFGAASVFALGTFGPDLTKNLHAIGATPVADAQNARQLADVAKGGTVVVFGAKNARAVRIAFEDERPRFVVVASVETAAEALDALDAGADEVIGDTDTLDTIEAALFPNSPARESSAFQTPRLADLGARMATIAHDIEALLQPQELRHIERSSPITTANAPKAMTNGTPGASQVRTLIRARRDRANYLPSDLFADPAWDMLLDLVAARLERKPVSVSSLCIAAAVPPTTALRWIKTMTDNGLLERKADPADRRRVFIDLSERAATAMDAYLTRPAAATGSLVPV